ncbi:hypothetical protein L2E82_43865 [Cichorium intybus]|uniref:Uncharacterized protein n=1 Tax=Cichorium intybus TaxID=13427 RepID=A0ACB8ZP58_CICIN|nr:hypothetical protein L2E82_43865 [Cichorium intybus]
MGNEREEGEFVIEDEEKSDNHSPGKKVKDDAPIDDDGDMAVDGAAAADELRPPQEDSCRMENQQSEDMVVSNDEPARMGNITRMEIEETAGNNFKNGNIEEMVTKVNPDESALGNPRGPATDEHFNGLIKAGCFGPFPYPSPNCMGNKWDSNVSNDSRFDIGGSIGKRRRLEVFVSRLNSSTVELSPVALNLDNAFQNSHYEVPTEKDLFPPTFDLNNSGEDANSTDTCSIGNSLSTEARKTIEIG